MVIHIKSSDGIRLTLPLPNALLLNAAVAGWVTWLAGRHLPAGRALPITPAQAQQLVRALRRWRRYTPDRTLVEVHSADGDEVCIRL